VRWLRRFGDVRALHFRGHGSSAGGSAVGGDPEVRDVDAAVRIGRWALDVVGDTAGRGSAAVPAASATIPA
jgi:hypothetical protein